ncbi:YesK family protein [Bacillus sp. HSf4]|uniref:YesK family protein n=1 Tax=unclassified Bacillus (in: firmicutes) TaxID=185979 RepID=UPI00240946C9|nr:YesK family protein [Bacillus sp. HSf4]WFA04488.1 YesK family protein [Bacillus sp. HSf4]
MFSFWLTTAFLAAIIFGISFIFRKKESPLQYAIPSGVMTLGIISLIIGGWEGCTSAASAHPSSCHRLSHCF